VLSPTLPIERSTTMVSRGFRRLFAAVALCLGIAVAGVSPAVAADVSDTGFNPPFSAP
jgi:hypothetical protein